MWYNRHKAQRLQSHADGSSAGFFIGMSIQDDLIRYQNDPSKLSRIQEQMISDRKREIASSVRQRRYYEDQHKAAMNNKAEWVKRGRDPRERIEALKG